MPNSSARPPVRSVLRAARKVRALCEGLPLTRVEFEDGTLEWHPRGYVTTRGTVTIFAEENAET